ncbi:response regulator transcription factor [Micromonospora sp. WMMD1128]|uniref:response regulator transcription factor n=1 Tax=unclassified Micromonospora TaxID=2617518 RepID=UPI00248B6D02|nr:MULTISPECIES: response regulator transcription factor [unclassified Micromonospora]WBB73928.1 response regulator transcription factor [Micromonospora sp. WMMD1128]WFE32672.1 response regulator transcription factor [Micromonospora sp. WMMD975]
MRIVIADDAVLIREGLSALLRQAGMTVLAAVKDAHELLDAVAAHRPDAAIVDIRMPPTYTTEGLAVAERIRRDYPGIAVLVLSMHIETEYALAIVNSGEGGVGYLLKERILDVEQVVTALRELTNGGAVIDPALVEELMARHRTGGRIDRLTVREQEVLALMAQGLTNRAIADRLRLSSKTIESYVTSILERLQIDAAEGVHRRVRAVLMYLRSNSSAGWGA